MTDAKTPAEKPKPAARKPAAKKPDAAVPPVPPPPAAPAAPTAPAAEVPPAAPLPPAAPAYAPVPLRPEEERNIAMLSHLVSLLAILLSASWISALIFYLIYKDRGPFVRQHTATELNFQLTMVIGIIAGVVLSLIFVGFLLLLAVPVLMIIFGIIATMRANQGQPYVYPIAIKFVQ